jgi:hypothetical protein
MMRKTLVVACLFLAVSMSLGGASQFQEDYKLWNHKCTQCHEMTWYLWPRSFKGWQLTVENMQSYAYGETSFTDEEAERIARFLGDYAGEGLIIVPEGELTSSVAIASIDPETVEPVELEPEVVEPEVVAAVEPEVVEPEAIEPATAVAPVEQPTKPSVPIPLRKRIWNPSRNALRGARTSGFIAVICLAGLLFTGFKRRTLKQRFRQIHVKLALGLFVALSVHGIIYIAEYGTPGVTWYWFGLVGFITLIVTELQGIVRKRFHKGLLMSHIVAACLGLALSILHWIWAWL